METLANQALAPTVSLAHHRILIVHPPQALSQLELRPHELFFSPDLESADGTVSEERPDIVVCFADQDASDLENHVMTWLIEGFRGSVIVFDPRGQIEDYDQILQGQVIDDYVAGPVSAERFMAILRSKLLKSTSFAPPRAMTTFDLFRNLFDRGLSAIFFFSQELEHCVAANLRAEELTGYSFAELKRMKLQDLCHPDEFDKTLQSIRRAKHRYYDVTGFVDIVDRTGQRRNTEFSCGYFNFGRKSFVKIEIQAFRSALPH